MISLWDLLFGTFEYHPGRNPQRLGVTEPARYPEDREWLKVLVLPFRAR